MQLGPQSRMPCLLARETHCSWSLLPLGPTSAKPADSMTMPLTFLAAHSSMVLGSEGAGTKNRARSKSVGMDDTSG